MNQVQALFLASSLSRRMGGIHEIMCGISREMVSQGVHVEAFGMEDDFSLQDTQNWERVPNYVFPIYGPKSFGYSPELRLAVLQSGADILHLHNLWMFPSLVALDWIRLGGAPLIVTINGMLEPWALQNSGWKKRIATMLYEKKLLSAASCLQANTLKEYSDIRSFGLKAPVAIIPNGVHLPLMRVKPQREKKTLLYLGRIHPKKGLETALRGWAKFKRACPNRSENWRFVISGWDQGGHEAQLKKICVELGLRVDNAEGRSLEWGSETEVIFFGPAFGVEKEDLFYMADAFILPSLSEGLPMAVLEAWSYSLPVLMTEHCNLNEGFDLLASIKIEATPDSVADGLKRLYSMSDIELMDMGSNGRNLVADRFTWKKVANQMKEVYEWSMGGGAAPESVIK